MSSIEELKNKGNAAFSSGQHEEAIKYFTEAIKLDGTNAVLFSNRSAAYASLNDYSHALEDANKTIELRSDWAKVSIYAECRLRKAGKGRRRERVGEEE
jgi:stress-induced-phosphoprotein 1